MKLRVWNMWEISFVYCVTKEYNIGGVKLRKHGPWFFLHSYTYFLLDVKFSVFSWYFWIQQLFSFFLFFYNRSLDHFSVFFAFYNYSYFTNPLEGSMGIILYKVARWMLSRVSE